MKKLVAKLERIFSAAAFAEAGEYDTARGILKEEESPRKTDHVTPTVRLRRELKTPGIKR